MSGTIALAYLSLNQASQENMLGQTNFG
ncbi:integrase [Lactobacillus helveticus]|nr:integrase [Lactobacillus helveticus]MCT0191715.1 integrase [Lactobacillus helveticus]MCT0197536.1 integrase [Lactobacillus helveticus]